MDDNEIVDLYWKRNEQAIKETNEKYGAYCLKISLNILADMSDSEENVNDTYWQAWSSIPPQRPNSLKAFPPSFSTIRIWKPSSLKASSSDSVNSAPSMTTWSSSHVPG